MSERHLLTMPDDGRTIAVDVEDGAGPTVLWLGGFRSDMTGTKAEALAAWGRKTGRRVVRFDYSGHGASGGPFSRGRISRWLAEAQAVRTAFAPGAVILVGSSMGGWIALLMARGRALAPALQGLVLVAPAADFTDKLMLPALGPAARETVAAGGDVRLPGYDDTDPGVTLSAAFFKDGKTCNLLDGPLAIGAPVIILQGMVDTSVPYRHAQLLVDRLADDDVTLTLVRNGDHRLSRPADIARLIAAVESLLRS